MSSDDERNEFFHFSDSVNSLEEKNNSESIFSKIKKTLFIVLLGQILTIIYSINEYLFKEIIENFKFPILFNSFYFIIFGIFWIIFQHGFSKIQLSNLIIIIFYSQNIFFKSIIKYKEFPFDISYIYFPLTIFFTIILNFFYFSKIQNSLFHFIGIIIVIIGISYLYYFIEYNIDDLKQIKAHFISLLFIIISSLFFSATIILIQKFLKKSEIKNFFTYLGIIGGLILFSESFIYIEPINYQKKKIIEFRLLYLILLLIFNSSIFIGIYPYFIKSTSAGIFNINLCTYIFWYFILELIFGKQSNFHYYIGFIIIFFGISIFSIITSKNKLKKDKFQLNIH